jgi:ABC-type nitrate/sulfonate/bicarbonate transport system ATPase subunit
MTVAVSDLSRRFSGPPAHLALDRLDFTVEAGEFLCLVGPSGSGKTTLLRILAGLDRGFTGRLSLPPGLHSAIVFQEPRLMPWLTVLENLLLVAPSAAKPAAAKPAAGETAARERALALLGELDIAGFADAYPGQLSGGMQRRVALARALLVAPELLLMDEPFVSLDMPTASHLRALVTRLWRNRRMTSIFVTHDLREAMVLATRLLFLTRSPGRAVLDWRPDLPPPGERGAAEIEAALAALLARHPRLLEGAAGT